MPRQPPETPESELTDLTIKEGSLVVEGDNPEANVVMFKTKKEEEPKQNVHADVDPEKVGFLQRVKDWVSAKVGKAEFEMQMPMTTAEIMRAEYLQKELDKCRMYLQDSVSRILNYTTGDEQAKLLQKTVQEFNEKTQLLLSEMAESNKAAAEDFSDILDLMNDSVFKGDVQSGRELFAQSVEKLMAFEVPPETHHTEKSEDQVSKEAPANKSLEDVLKALPEEDRALVEAELKAKQAPKEEPPAITKGMTDEQAEAFKALQAEVAKLKDQDLAAKYANKAREICKADIGMSLEDTAEALRKAYEVSPESGAAVEQALRAAAAQATKGAALMQSFGHAYAPAKAMDQETAEKLEKLKADKPGMTDGEALLKLSKSDPAAFAQIVANG